MTHVKIINTYNNSKLVNTYKVLMKYSFAALYGVSIFIEILLILYLMILTVLEYV